MQCKVCAMHCHYALFGANYALCTVHYELPALPCTAACIGHQTLVHCCFQCFAKCTIYNASARHHSSELKVFWFEWHEKLSGLFCRPAPNSLYNLTLPLTNEFRDELSWSEDWLYNASCSSGLECWKRVMKTLSVAMFLEFLFWWNPLKNMPIVC